MSLEKPRLGMVGVGLLLAALAPDAAAAPVVSGVSQSLAHGQAATLTGTGFGAKTPAAPDLWDTVENHYSLPDGTLMPTGSPHPWELNKGDSVYLETTDPQRGVGSAFYKGVAATVGGRTVSGAFRLYLSWWEKSDRDVMPDSEGVDFPYQEEGAGHSSKFLRLNGSGYHFDPGRQTLSWTQMQFYTYDNGTCVNEWSEVPLTPVEAWHFIEVFVDQRSGVHWARVDGRTVANSSSNSCAEWDWDYVWWIGFDRGGNRPPSPVIGLDDIYVDRTQARVMLGDAPTLASSTHLEVQPATAWTESSVTVTVNQGAFADCAAAHLFVVDETGEASAGLPVVLGACQTPDAGSGALDAALAGPDASSPPGEDASPALPDASAPSGPDATPRDAQSEPDSAAAQADAGAALDAQPGDGAIAGDASGTADGADQEVITEGCGCSASPGASVAAVWAALLLLGWRTRRLPARGQ